MNGGNKMSAVNKKVIVDVTLNDIKFKQDLNLLISSSVKNLSSISKAVYEVSKELSLLNKKIPPITTNVNFLAKAFEKYKEIKSIIGELSNAFNKNTKEIDSLANIAKITFKTIMTPASIGIVASAIGALAVTFSSLSKNANESTDIFKQNMEAAKKAKIEMSDLKEKADQNMLKSQAEIDLLKLQGDKILETVDINGKLEKSNDGVREAVEKLNTVFGEEYYYFDEQTGRLMDQNGAVINLLESYDKLLLKMEGQAWINSHQESYDTAYSASKTASGKITDNKYQLKELENSVDWIITRAYERIYQSWFNGIITEFERDSLILKEAEKFKIDDIDNFAKKTREHHDNLVSDIKIAEGVISGNESEIKTFTTMKMSMLTGNYDMIKIITSDLFSYYDLINQDSKTFAEQLVIFEKKILVAEDYVAKGGKYLNGYLDNMVSLYNFLSDKFMEKTNMRASDFLKELEELEKLPEVKKIEETAGEIVQTSVEAVVNGITSAFSNSEDGFLTNIDSIVKTAMDNMLTKVADIVIPNKYFEIIGNVRVNDSTGSVKSTKTTGATFDDYFNPSGFVSTSSLISQARETIGNITDRMARSVLGQQMINYETELSNSNVIVNQQNVFNTPVEKPSQTSRKIAEVNRQLGKLVR